MELLSALKVVVDSSTTMTAWALSLVAASIAAIVSTSYLRPSNERVRLIYLLYLSGWLFLGVSIYFGDRVSRRYVAAQFVNEGVLRTIAEKVNRDYGCQQTVLMIGLLTFGLWLTLFLLWWIFGEWKIANRKE
jgi:hypothetical protein